MTKLHITTEVNYGYFPVDVGKNIADENTINYGCKECNGEKYDACSNCDRADGDWQYLAGTVKPFTNYKAVYDYTGIALANSKHVTIHYGNKTDLPEGLFFDMPVVVKVIGKSTNKAGKCLVVEVLIPGHKTLTEQI